MSNLTFPYAPGFGGANAPVLKFVDQLDGTYALPVAVLSGGSGGGGAGYSITDLILQDSTGAQGIRREKIDPAGTVTFVYENFDGTAWTPTAPMVAVAIAPGAGLATSAKQDTGNTSVASIDTKTPTVGQKAMAASSPVVLASDQSSIPVTMTQPADLSTTGALAALNAAATLTGLSGASSAVLQVLGTYVGTVVLQTSPDGGTTWVTQVLRSEATTPAIETSVLASAAVGSWKAAIAGASQVRVLMSAYTSGTANVTLRASTAAPSTVGLNQTVNLTTINGTAIIGQTTPGGATGSTPVVGISSSTNQIVINGQSATAATLSALGGGIIVESGGSGTVCSFLVNLTAFTAGSSTGLDIFLQYSSDGGTNWNSIWQCEAFTATGTAYIPAIYIPGRYRFAYINRGGTATTATVTITATKLSLTARHMRQFFDRTAGVLAGTASAVTSWYDVSGCENIAVWLPIGTASGPGTYQVQLSADGVNALPAGTATVGVASTTTAYPVTLGLTARFVRLAVTTASTSQTSATTPIVITAC